MFRDEAYLLDILTAARKALRFAGGLSRDEFLRDELLQLAIMRILEIIGEASRKVSPEFKLAHPEVPWPKMVGLRHRLVHEYFRINLNEVWYVVETEIRPLIALIEPLVMPDQ